MINLLLKERKVSLNRMYYVRLATVFVFMMAVVVLLAVLAELAAVKDTAKDPKDELSSIVADINKKLGVFASPAERFVFSRDGLLPILGRKNDSILITNISYDGTGTAKKMTVNGVAKNREALLSFEGELKKEADFQGINVPISNFVQGSNISFSIQFTVK
jgi:hypothetical protein